MKSKFFLISLLFFFFFFLFLMGKERKVREKIAVVSINVVATDMKGRPIGNLTSDDFEVYDNGKKVPLIFFEKIAMPSNIVLMVDSSGSSYKRISIVKESIINFLDSIYREKPQDRVAVVNFNEDINLLADFKTSLLVKKALIQNRIYAGGATALYDAIDLVSSEILSRIPGRKIVIIYTDSIDNESIFQFKDIFKEAISTDATFYVVVVDNRREALKDAAENFYSLRRKHYYEYLMFKKGMKLDGIKLFWTEDMRNQYDPKDVLDFIYKLSFTRLAKLAAYSGGEIFKVKNYNQISSVYGIIASSIPYHYTLGFKPNVEGLKRGTFRNIKVVVKRKGVNLRYRKGYFVR